MLTSLNVPVSVQAKDEEECAYIDFNKSDSKNVSKYAFVNGSPTAVRKGGRNGYSCAAGTTDYLLVDIDDKFLYNDEAIDYVLSVDYFDSGKGKFTMRSTNSVVTALDTNDIVQLEDTGEWKTHDFYIYDGTLDNRVMKTGYDFAISTWGLVMLSSPEPVIFGGMRLKKLPDKLVRINIATEHLGNMFDDKDEKKFSVTLTNNYKSEVTADVTYRIIDINENVLYEKADSVSLTDERVLEFVPDFNKYGSFRIEVEVKAKDLEKTETINKNVYFSIIDKFEKGEKKNELFGIDMHSRLYYKEQSVLEEMAEIMDISGAYRYRTGVALMDIEQEKGKYVYPTYTNTYGLLYEKGLEADMSMSMGGVTHYGKSDYWPVTEEEKEGFSKFAVNAIKQFRTEVKNVELFNEPNFRPYPATSYLEAIKPIYESIKKATPDINVVGGVMGMVPHSWMTDFFEAGGLKYIDTLSIHPYDFNGGFSNKTLRSDLTQTRERMAKYGAEDMELWITEMGWSTGNNCVEGVPEELAAAYGVQYFNMVKAERLADVMHWYDLENDGDDPGDRENNFGLLYRPAKGGVKWAAKLPYVAFVNLNHLYAEAEYVDGFRPSEESAVYHYKRSNGEKDFIAVWSNDENRTVNLDLKTPQVEIFDIYGNKLYTLSSDNGIYSFSLNEIPYYIVGDIGGLEEKEGDISVEKCDFDAIPGEEVVFKVTDRKNRNLKINTDIEEVNKKMAKDSVERTEKTEKTKEAKETETETKEELKPSVNIIENKNGELKVSVSKELFETVKFNVEVFADNSLVYKGEIAIRPLEPVACSLKAEAVNDNYYKMCVTVQNLSSTKAISGDIKLLSPEDIAKASSTAKIVDLKPGGTQSFELSLPRMIRKRAKAICAEIALESGYKKTVENMFGFIDSSYAENKPVIDGKIQTGEWKGAQFVSDTIDNVVQAKDSKGNPISPWGGKNDMSYTGFMMWDEDNLYLAVDLKDNMHTQNETGTNVWRGDSLQLGICKPGDTVFNEIAVSLTKSGTEVYEFNSNFGVSAGIIDKAECGIVRTNTGTSYEVKIPWSELLGVNFDAEEGEEIMFSMLANDADGGNRRLWMEFGSGIGQKKDVSKFVNIKLKK